MKAKLSPSKGCQGELIRAFMMKLPTGAGMSFCRLIIAESEFLDDAMDNFNVLWREFQDLEAGIMHIQAEIGFAPPAAGREFHERFFSNLR